MANAEELVHRSTREMSYNYTHVYSTPSEHNCMVFFNVQHRRNTNIVLVCFSLVMTAIKALDPAIRSVQSIDCCVKKLAIDVLHKTVAFNKLRK